MAENTTLASSESNHPSVILSPADNYLSLPVSPVSGFLLATWQALRTHVDIPILGSM